MLNKHPVLHAKLQSLRKSSPSFLSEEKFVMFSQSYSLVLLIYHTSWLSISFESHFERIFLSCLSANVCQAPLLILGINVLMYSTYDVLTIFCNLYHHHLLACGGGFWIILWVSSCGKVFTDDSNAVLLFHDGLATTTGQHKTFRGNICREINPFICGSICFPYISKLLGHAFSSIFV